MLITESTHRLLSGLFVVEECDAHTLKGIERSMQLYRVDARTNVARLARVKLGRGSSDRIEVLSGLDAGDTVIVSDTSAYNGAPTLRLR